MQPRGRLVGCLIGSLDLGRPQFGRLGLQYLHGLRDFWVRLRVPRTRHERGRCDEASSGQETNKKALAIHVSGLLSMRDGRFGTPRFNAAVDVKRKPRHIQGFKVMRMNLEEETSPGSPTISNSLRDTQSKKVLRRAAIAFSYQRYVAAYPAGWVYCAVSPNQNR